MKIAAIQSFLNEKALPAYYREYSVEKALVLAEMEAHKEATKCIGMIRKAAEGGSKLIVTIEAFNHCLFYELSHPHMVELGMIAKEYGCYIVAGLHTLEEGRRYNSAVLFGPEGRIIGIYHKVHLSAGEEKEVRAGDSYPVFRLPWGILGILICWDMQFPEAARCLALQGVDIIACPTWGWEDIYGLCRAYENSVYVVGTMGVPTNESWWAEHMSRSCIVDPMGRKVAQAKTGDPEIVTAEIEVQKEPEPQYGSEKITGHTSMRYTRLLQRRPDTYEILTQEHPKVYSRYDGREE